MELSRHEEAKNSHDIDVSLQLSRRSDELVPVVERNRGDPPPRQEAADLSSESARAAKTACLPQTSFFGPKRHEPPSGHPRPEKGHRRRIGVDPALLNSGEFALRYVRSSTGGELAVAWTNLGTRWGFARQSSSHTEARCRAKRGNNLGVLLGQTSRANAAEWISFAMSLSDSIAINRISAFASRRSNFMARPPARLQIERAPLPPTGRRRAPLTIAQEGGNANAMALPRVENGPPGEPRRRRSRSPERPERPAVRTVNRNVRAPGGVLAKAILKTR